MGKIYRIEEISNLVQPIARYYGVKTVRLFGSYARSEATESSDIDFLIEKGRIRNLLDYFGFVSALEEQFNIHVDVVTSTCEDRDFLQEIGKEAVLVYDEERQDGFAEDFAVL